MNRDIRLSVTFWDHWKTVVLKEQLGYPGVESLQRLWCFAAQNKPDGRLLGMNARAIEIASRWAGAPGEFTAKLIELVFLDAQDGVYLLHDWEEHNGYAAHANERSEQARKAAEARWKRRNGGHSGPKGGKNADSIATSNAQSISQSNAECNAPSPYPYPYPDPVQKSGESAPARPATTGKGTRWQAGQTVPQEWIAWARREHPDIDAEDQAKTFADFWVAKPGKDGCKLDWEATWRNWIRRAYPKPAGKAMAGNFSGNTARIIR